MTHPLPTEAQFQYQAPDADSLLAQFSQAANWQERYRQIMLLGKALPTLEDELRVDAAQVRGCESQAWLYHREISGRHYFLADSDARIVKGLIGLLLAACHGKTLTEIDKFDAGSYFQQLGLVGQLSPSRSNGLYALANAMVAQANGLQP